MPSTSLPLQTNRFLSEFSTFSIGGPIRYFLEISSEEEMQQAFLFCRKERLPFLILGKGSNCLFPDEGFAGLALLNKINFCRWKESSVQVGAGYSFSLLGVQSAKRGFSELAFAAGIPASVGGAIFMNAGASGRETAEALCSVRYLSFCGEEREYRRDELSFQYRTSPFQTMQGTILSATFAFSAPAEEGEARKKQLQLLEKRMCEQPLKEKSAGCIFRNPKEGAAGALIDRCALKGVSVGGAKVSEMHANFIVNTGEATAHDVRQLIQLIQKRVYEKTGICLEPEIRIVS